MSVLRTPDAGFLHLPDFPFQPNYAEINGVRVHYLDEGNGGVILCQPRSVRGAGATIWPALGAVRRG
jgi:hypothetical protein